MTEVTPNHVDVIHERLDALRTSLETKDFVREAEQRIDNKISAATWGVLAFMFAQFVVVVLALTDKI